MAEMQTSQGLVVGLILDMPAPAPAPEVTKLEVSIGAAKLGFPLSVEGEIPAGARYQWLASTTPAKTFEPIEGATERTYTPTANEVGMYVKAEVAYAGETYLTNGKKVTA